LPSKADLGQVLRYQLLAIQGPRSFNNASGTTCVDGAPAVCTPYSLYSQDCTSERRILCTCRWPRHCGRVSSSSPMSQITSGSHHADGELPPLGRQPSHELATAYCLVR